MKTRDFYQKYANFARKTGDYYFLIDKASSILLDAKKNNIACIGIEGFEFANNKLYPHVDKIVDLSYRKNENWPEFVAENYDSALKFIKKFKNDRKCTHLALVLVNEEDYGIC